MFYEELEIGLNDIEYMWGILVAVRVYLASSKKTSYAWKQRRFFYAIAVINYIGKSWHLHDLSYLRIDEFDVVFNMLGLYTSNVNFHWPITLLIFPMYRRWIAHFMETLEQLIDQISELSYVEWWMRRDISLLRLQSFQEVDDHFLNWKVFRCQRLKNLIATQVNGIWRLVYFIFSSRLLPLL